MNLWSVAFNTLRPLNGYAVLDHLCLQEQKSEAYHFEGRYRQGENHCIFQYTLEGQGVFRDESGEHVIDSGKGFLCRASDARTAYYYPDDCRKPWKFVWFTFAGDAAFGLVDEIIYRSGHVFELPQKGHLLAPLLSYERLSGTPQEIDAATSARMVTDFLLGLAEITEAGRETDPEVLLVKRAMRIVRDNIADDINASELAKMLGITREHFGRVFKTQTGQTPYQYILRQKSIRACKYLKDTDLTQKEIAQKLGHPSVESFSRAFTRVMKISPGKYRNHGAPPVG